MITNNFGTHYQKGDLVFVSFALGEIPKLCKVEEQLNNDPDLIKVVALDYNENEEQEILSVRRERVKPAFVGDIKPFQLNIPHNVLYPTANTAVNPAVKPNDLGKHYRYSYKGIKLDPYRILSVYNVTCPAMQHAIKKLLRAGNSIKDLQQDISEVILTLERKLEMIEEDESDN